MTAPAEFDPRPWAAAQLEVPPDAPPADARAALRCRLADDDFVPPWGVQQAGEILLQGNRSNLAQAQARLEEEQRLWAEVDDFAGEFFDMPPEKRRRRWQSLRVAGAFSPLLTARLRALEPGLNVLPPGEAAPDVAELARHVCDLFVLRPAARAAHRQTLLLHMKADIRRWQAAARVLRPLPVAALLPDFVDYVAYRETRLRQQAKAMAKRQKAAELAAVGTSGTNPSGSWTWVLIVVGIVLGIVRGTAESNRSPSPRPTPPLLDFKQFPIRPTPIENEELKRIIRDIQKRTQEIEMRQQPEKPARPPIDPELLGLPVDRPAPTAPSKPPDSP